MSGRGYGVGSIWQCPEGTVTWTGALQGRARTLAKLCSAFWHQEGPFYEHGHWGPFQDMWLRGSESRLEPSLDPSLPPKLGGGAPCDLGGVCQDPGREDQRAGTDAELQGSREPAAEHTQGVGVLRRTGGVWRRAQERPAWGRGRGGRPRPRPRWGALGRRRRAFEPGCAKRIRFPFFFLFSDFNQEQMSEQAGELETSEVTVRAEV